MCMYVSACMRPSSAQGRGCKAVITMSCFADIAVVCFPLSGSDQSTLTTPTHTRTHWYAEHSSCVYLRLQQRSHATNATSLPRRDATSRDQPPRTA